MITFTYTARSLESGQTVTADVEAENAQAAAKLLMSQQLFPISIEQKSAKGLQASIPFLNKVKVKDRVIFTRQLATLINAGLPLLQSIRTVRDGVTSKLLQEVVDKVIVSLESGLSFSGALAKHPTVFNNVYVSMVAAGEASGTLDQALERLANQQEKDEILMRKVRGAMVYPVIVLGVIALVMVFMLTTVLPQISQLYKDLKTTMPILTRGLLALSNFLINYWWLALIMVVGAALGLRNYFKSEPGQRQAAKMKMGAPVFGNIFRKLYMARFSRTLGTLLGSGIPMLQAMGVVKEAVNNVLVAESVDRAIIEVKGGKALSASLEGDPNILPLVPQMIRIGEQSGAMDAMLEKVSSFYENEVDDEVKNLSTSIEPLLMVVMGVTVGLVIAAILLPVYSLVGSGGLSGMK
jgi:type IV pilus assembly protein PilC